MKLLALAALVVAVACGKRADATAKAAAIPDPTGLDTNAPVSAAIGGATSPVAFDRWVVKSDTSAMDGTVSTRVAGLADGRDPAADYPAMLFLQCTGPSLDAYVAIDDIVDYHSNEVAMRVRVDSAPAATEMWTRSENDRGAFSHAPRALLAKLRTAHRLLMEIPVYGKGREVASWSLDGLAGHLTSLSSCVK